jgi:MOSC domain-containing protein YiiM
LGPRGFTGDASFEECHHTPNMDVHVFSLDRYAHYELLAQRTFPVPAFGENLSVRGGLETEVCIGDRYSNGEVVVEVSQPTERCGTPGRSLGLPMLRKWIEECLHTGYYLRVIRPGYVTAGDEFLLQDRPLPEWSVDRINRALFRGYTGDELYDAVLALPLLSTDWKERLTILRARWLSADARRSAAQASHPGV